MPIPKLLFLVPLLLTACVKPGPVLPPEPYVELAALLAAVDLTPRALPALEPAALGQSGILSGPTLSQFPVGQAVYLSRPGMTWPGAEVGRIVSRGQVELERLSGKRAGWGMTFRALFFHGPATHLPQRCRMGHSRPLMLAAQFGPPIRATRSPGS